MTDIALEVNFTTLTADGVIKGSSGRVYAFWITGDGTNAGRVIFYDNATAASGTILMELRCGANETRFVLVPGNQICLAGIYADVTTVGRVGAYFN